MAVRVVQKPKVKAKKKADVLQAPGPALTVEEREKVDRLAAVVKELEPMKPLVKEEADLRKFLASVAGDPTRFPGKEAAKLEGNEAVATFSPRGSSRQITDMHGLIQTLKAKMGGYDALLQILSVSLSDVDKYLTEAEQAPFISPAEGSRRFLGVEEK